MKARRKFSEAKLLLPWRRKNNVVGNKATPQAPKREDAYYAQIFRILLFSSSSLTNPW